MKNSRIFLDNGAILRAAEDSIITKEKASELIRERRGFVLIKHEKKSEIIFVSQGESLIRIGKMIDAARLTA